MAERRSDRGRHVGIDSRSSRNAGGVPATVEAAAPSSSSTLLARANPASASPTTTTAAPHGPRKGSGINDAEGDAGSPLTTSSASSSLSRCLVYCRLRPSNKQDFQDEAFPLVTLQDKRVILKDERHYDYDGTFGPESTQAAIFDTVAVPCILHAFKGFCAALMCYGQTGTGKSYTMCNTDPDYEGIIPRAARFIFEEAQRRAANDHRTYTVIGQFVQIYRDHLGDLMTSDGKDRVDIHYDAETGVSLTGCSSHELHDADAFMDFYREGNARRVVTATAMNPESSRGHTAMMVWIFSEDPDDPMAGRLKGKITFIDLAGYERFSKTGITSTNPIMKDEAKTINASLLALGHVVSSLSSGSKHIPWRNAKLTRILQDSIGGRSRTSIILTIGPSSNHLYETTNSLQFGLRAMAVKVEAKVSLTVNYEKLAQKLMGLLDERDARINVLELQIASRDTERQELLDRYQHDRAELEQRFARDLAQLTASGANDEQIQKLQEVFKVEVQNLEEQQNEEITYQDEQHTKEIARLINEQKHQEAKGLAEVKLAQERIVEEFQRKLDNAREGTNEDLVRALQQLSDKDAILVTRANDTARLHAHIEALTEQLEAMGVEPLVEAAFPQSFLDISQVEEMQHRMAAESERLHNKAVELRTQLDRMSLICNDRMEEVSHLYEENQQLRDQLQQAGVDRMESTEELERLYAKRAELVDPLELETVRLAMQAEIDEWKGRYRTQEEELQRLREERREGAFAASVRRRIPFASSLTASLRDPSLPPGVTALGDGALPSLSGTATPSHGAAQPFSKATSMCNTYRKMIRRLRNDLATQQETRAELEQRVQTLEQLLTDHAISTPPAQTPPRKASPGQTPTTATTGAAADNESSPLPLIDGGEQHHHHHVNPGLQSTSSFHSADEDARDAVSDATLEADLAKISPDVATVFSIKDADVKAHEAVLLALEKQLTTARATVEYQNQLIQALRTQLHQSGITPQEPVTGLQPVEGVPLDQYADLLRELRHSNRTLALRLLTRSAPTAATAAVAAGDGPAPTAAEEIAATLEERDNLLELKDELLLEKGAMAQYMVKMSARLMSQMETLGLTPCCTMPESYTDLAEAETDQLGVQTEKQRELEERLAAEQEEKTRMNRLLSAFNAEREHQMLVLRQAEEKNKELAERESRAKETLQKLVQEKTLRERMLEDAAIRATRELMDMQARAVRDETERKSSVFERLFGRFIDGSGEGKQ